MSWLEYDAGYRYLALNTPLYHTVYIKATENFKELDSLMKLVVAPTKVLGLEGFFVKATDFIASLMYVPILQSAMPMSEEHELYIHDAIATPSSTGINVSVPTFAVTELYNLGSYYVGSYYSVEPDFSDYNGYTKIDVYLPYLGFVSVNPNDVIGKWIQIRMAFNPQSGEATYYIGVNDENVGFDYANDAFIPSEYDKKTRVLSVHTCQLGIEIPIGTTNATEIQRNILLGTVKLAGTALASVAAGKVGAFVTKKAYKLVDTTKKRNPETKRLAVAKQNVVEGTMEIDRTAKEQFDIKNDCFKSAMNTLNSLHLEATSDRPNTSFNLADLDVDVHIIIYRPKIRPANDDYRRLYGAPLGKVKKLSTVSGYTEISAVHIGGEGFETATSEELIMIEEQLCQGVIF